MRKIIALLLAVFCVLSMASCNDLYEEDDDVRDEENDRDDDDRDEEDDRDDDDRDEEDDEDDDDDRDEDVDEIKKEVEDISVVFRVNYGGGMVDIFRYVVEEIKGKEITVCDVVKAALDKYEKDYEVSEDGKDIIAAFGHTTYENADSGSVSRGYWECTINEIVSNIDMKVYDDDFLVFTWVEETENKQDDTTAGGSEIGDRCAGSDLNVVDADGIKSKTVNPANTGMVTVINFWGTWCTPCVAELPYLDEISESYEDVSVIAVHTNTMSETAFEFISKHYSDSEITFLVDLSGEEYYSNLGGRGAYPYTVILDENGVIVEKILSALTYEELEDIVVSLGCTRRENSAVKEGNTVGSRIYSQSLDVIDENGITGEKSDPTATGKVTILNFWYSSCSWCKKEFPVLDEIATEYKDSITVIAANPIEDASVITEYVAENFADSDIIFASSSNAYASDLGINGYPTSFFIDENGVILRIEMGAITDEDVFRSIVEECLN